MRLIGKSDDRGKFYRPGGTWSSLLIPSDDVALLLRWRRIDKGRRDGTTREETMESALFLSSPFTNLASTPFTHTHDCLVNPPMSVYSSVPSSTWPPFPSFFFLSFSTFYPVPLSLPPFPFSFPLPTFRIPVPSLPRTRRCDIRVSELWIDADKRPRSFH